MTIQIHTILQGKIKLVAKHDLHQVSLVIWLSTKHIMHTPSIKATFFLLLRKEI